MLGLLIFGEKLFDFGIALAILLRGILKQAQSPPSCLPLARQGFALGLMLQEVVCIVRNTTLFLDFFL